VDSQINYSTSESGTTLLRFSEFFIEQDCAKLPWRERCTSHITDNA